MERLTYRIMEIDSNFGTGIVLIIYRLKKYYFPVVSYFLTFLKMKANAFKRNLLLYDSFQ